MRCSYPASPNVADNSPEMLLDMHERDRSRSLGAADDVEIEPGVGLEPERLDAEASGGSRDQARRVKEMRPHRRNADQDAGAVGLHGRETIAGWKSLASRGAWRDFVALLLMEHYDPAYRRSSERNFARLESAPRIAIRSGDDEAFDAAARELLQDTVAA